MAYHVAQYGKASICSMSFDVSADTYENRKTPLAGQQPSVPGRRIRMIHPFPLNIKCPRIQSACKVNQLMNFAIGFGEYFCQDLFVNDKFHIGVRFDSTTCVCYTLLEKIDFFASVTRSGGLA